MTGRWGRGRGPVKGVLAVRLAPPIPRPMGEGASQDWRYPKPCLPQEQRKVGHLKSLERGTPPWPARSRPQLTGRGQSEVTTVL